MFKADRKRLRVNPLCPGPGFRNSVVMLTAPNVCAVFVINLVTSQGANAFDDVSLLANITHVYH